MTTIAFDGKSLATDSIMCMKRTIVSEQSKKIIVCKNSASPYAAFARAGLTTSCLRLIKWISDGQYEQEQREAYEDESIVVAITKCGECHVYNTNHDAGYQKFDAPIAFGSGSDFALTAMDMGAHPIQAIRQAAKRDVYTGGKYINYFEVDTFFLGETLMQKEE